MRGWLRTLGVCAGLMGATGVALAAVGAHHSGNPNVTTAAYFLLFHGAALVGLCALCRDQAHRASLVAGTLIALGAVLFSGDLSLRALANLTPIRMAAPTGGMLMILGWLVAAFALPAALARSKLQRSTAID